LTLHSFPTRRSSDLFFDDKQVADSAFFYYNQSEKMYRLSPDNKEELARVILYKSGILNQVGILSEAEVETIKALNLLANENNTRDRKSTRLNSSHVK